MDLINNKGSPEDKMRMFLVWYLSLDGELSSEELGDYEKALHIAACDTRPIEFIKR